MGTVEKSRVFLPSSLRRTSSTFLCNANSPGVACDAINDLGSLYACELAPNSPPFEASRLSSVSGALNPGFTFSSSAKYFVASACTCGAWRDSILERPKFFVIGESDSDAD